MREINRNGRALQYDVLSVAWQVNCLPRRLRKTCSRPLRALFYWIASPDGDVEAAETGVRRLQEQLRSVGRDN